MAKRYSAAQATATVFFLLPQARRINTLTVILVNQQPTNQQTNNKMSLPYTEALSKLDDGRVKSIRPLVPPQILEEDLPLYVSYSPFLRCIHWNL